MHSMLAPRLTHNGKSFKASLGRLRKVRALYAKASQGISFSFSVTSREQKLIIGAYFIGQLFIAKAGSRNILCALYTQSRERLTGI